MALQKCLGCGKKISTDTDQCPKCREREPTNFYRSKLMYTKGRFWIFFMLGFVIVAVAISL